MHSNDRPPTSYQMDESVYRYYRVGTATAAGLRRACPICRRPIEEGSTEVFIASAASLDPIATVCGRCVRDIVANADELKAALAPHFPRR